MSLVEIESLIYDIYRGSRAAEFKASPSSVIEEYGLTNNEREAVLGQDYALLYELGVHPMLCMYLARANGLTVPAYLGLVGNSAAKISSMQIER